MFIAKDGAIMQLFENPGEKLKTCSIVFFICGIIGSIVLAFMFGVNKGDPTLLFFVLLIGGLVESFFSSLCLYAFGDFIENQNRTLNNTASMTKQLEEISLKLNAINNKIAPK